jgi:hypothetical protein
MRKPICVCSHQPAASPQSATLSLSFRAKKKRKQHARKLPEKWALRLCLLPPLTREASGSLVPSADSRKPHRIGASRCNCSRFPHGSSVNKARFPRQNWRHEPHLERGASGVVAAGKRKARTTLENYRGSMPRSTLLATRTADRHEPLDNSGTLIASSVPWRNNRAVEKLAADQGAFDRPVPVAGTACVAVGAGLLRRSLAQPDRAVVIASVRPMWSAGVANVTRPASSGVGKPNSPRARSARMPSGSEHPWNAGSQETPKAQSDLKGGGHVPHLRYCGPVCAGNHCCGGPAWPPLA